MFDLFILDVGDLSGVRPLVQQLRVLQEHLGAGFEPPVVVFDGHRQDLEVGKRVSDVLK